MMDGRGTEQTDRRQADSEKNDDEIKEGIVLYSKCAHYVRMPTRKGSSFMRLESTILEKLHEAREEQSVKGIYRKKIPLDEFIDQILDVYFGVNEELGRHIDVDEAKTIVKYAMREYVERHPEIKQAGSIKKAMLAGKVSGLVAKGVVERANENKASEKEAKPED